MKNKLELWGNSLRPKKKLEWKVRTWRLQVWRFKYLGSGLYNTLRDWECKGQWQTFEQRIWWVRCVRLVIIRKPYETEMLPRVTTCEWGCRHKLNVMVMKCLRSICVGTRMDTVWNEEVTYKFDAREKTSDKVVRKVFKCLKKLSIWVRNRCLQQCATRKKRIEGRELSVAWDG